MFGEKKFDLIIITHLFILIFITLITFRNLIFHGIESYLAGMDAFGFYADASIHLNKFYIWNEASTGQPLAPILNNIFQPLSSFINIISFINILLMLIFLLTGISMYILSYYLFRNRWTALISAIIYMLNIWILGKWCAGHFRHIFAYSLIPLCYLFFEKYLDTIDNKYLVSIVLILSFIILCGLDAFFIFITSFIVYTIVVLFVYKRMFTMEFIVKKLLFSSAILLFLTLYIFLPLYVVGSPRINTFYSVKVIKNFSLNLLNTIFGNTVELSYLAWVGHTDWNTHPILPYWLYKISQMIIPLLSMSVLLIPSLKRNSRIVALSLSAVVSIFFAKSLHPPFGDFYIFILDVLPAFHSLSVPNRFVMNVWFAYSLLAPLALYEIYDKIKSVNARYIGIVIILILLTFGLSSCYSIFKLGFLVWNPPKNEVQVHLWLLNHSTDLPLEEKYARIITVPYGQIRMFVSGGWLQHDLGYKSTIFNHRSVFSYLPRSKIPYPFYQYTEYIVKNNISRKISKILGIYDVRYIVVQGYPWTQPAHEIFGGMYKYNYKQHEYFEHLSGIKLIYRGSPEKYYIYVYSTWTNIMARNLNPPKMKKILANREPRVYLNKYWVPRIFAPRGTIVVVGGLNAFLKLASINSFSFRDWNLIFADHILKHLGRNELIKQIKRSDYVLFVDSTPTDLAMMLANSTWIKSKKLVSGKSFGWFEDSWPVIKGYFAYDNYVISSHLRGARVTYDVRIDKKFNYSVWVRVFISNQAGNLKVIMDNKTIGYINAHDKNTLGFKWVKAGEVKLDKGMHTLEIINLNGHNKINCILVIKKGLVKKLLKYTKILICNKDIYMFDVSMLSKLNLNSNVTKRNVFLFKDNRPLHRYILKFRHKYNVTYIKFRKISPVKWVVYINSTGPYTLVFSDTYHKMWRAYVGGDEYKSIPSYYFINSFRINESGNYKVVIEFIGQKIQNVCLIISGLAYLGCMGYLLYDWRWKSK